MSPDTKSQVKTVGGTLAVVGTALTIGVLMIPQPAKRAFLQWDNGHGVDGITATVTDIEFTTNFTHWTRIGSVTNTNVFPMLKVNPALGFYRVSHRVRADGTME